MPRAASPGTDGSQAVGQLGQRDVANLVVQQVAGQQHSRDPNEVQATSLFFIIGGSSSHGSFGRNGARSDGRIEALAVSSTRPVIGSGRPVLFSFRPLGLVSGNVPAPACRLQTRLLENGMTDIPRDDHLESSLALLGEGYPLHPRSLPAPAQQCFQARLLMQNTICLSGEQAARLFYDERHFQRAQAMPRMLKTLLGRGGVQGLDGEAHRHRKRMFLQLLDAAAVDELVGLTERSWRQAIGQWQAQGEVQLLGEVQMLPPTVSAAGPVPLPSAERELRRDQLAQMIDGAGGIGPRHRRRARLVARPRPGRST